MPIADILSREGEQAVKAGNEWRWKRHDSVTFHGNKWYQNSRKYGSYAIDFMQEFYNMSFPEAVCYLLNGEQGEVIHGKNSQSSSSSSKKGTGTSKRKQENPTGTSEEQQKQLTIPEKNDNMKRVYAYLLQKRYLSREIISFFARQGTLYESKNHHNAVFAGTDPARTICHVHKKGTYTEGESFRINEDGSNPCYGFGHAGKNNKLYVFEAPIDFLSFLSLYPKDWQENSYIVLNGVAEHAMLQMLSDYPNLDTIILCLDHDPAGIEGCGRLKEILKEQGYLQVKRLQSEYKDWNEDLKVRKGHYGIPAREHPKILEFATWAEVMKELCRDTNLKYATKEYLIRYYNGIYDDLKDGLTKDNLEAAFDGNGLLLSGMAVKCVERFGKELGKDTGSAEIIDYLKNHYQPHKDKGNAKTKIRELQRCFEEVMEIYNKLDMSRPENKELAAKKCMSLALSCVQAHIFVSVDMKNMTMVKTTATEQKEQIPERGMVCSQL